MQESLGFEPQHCVKTSVFAYACNFSTWKVEERVFRSSRSYSAQLGKFEANVGSLKPCWEVERRERETERTRESHIIPIHAQLPRILILLEEKLHKSQAGTEAHTWYRSEREWQGYTRKRSFKNANKQKEIEAASFKMTSPQNSTTQVLMSFSVKQTLSLPHHNPLGPESIRPATQKNVHMGDVIWKSISQCHSHHRQCLL